MNQNYLAIDFEYFGTEEEKIHLVCAGARIGEEEPHLFWLDERYPDNNRNEFIEFLIAHKDYVLLSWYAPAEARSFLALNLSPLDFRWIDLKTEYFMRLNGNHKLSYGDQLISGHIVNTHFIPKRERTEYQKRMLKFSPPEYNLLAATYKLLKIKGDKSHKDQMRDLILTRKFYSEEERKRIEDYCLSDITNLLPLWEEIQKIDKTELEEVFHRGKYGAISAIMENNGYPIDRKKIKKISENAPKILEETALDILSQFPGCLVWNPKRKAYSKKISKLEEYLREQIKDFPWPKTESGKMSFDMEYLKSYADPLRNYQRDNFVHQYIRYAETQSALSRFTTPKNPISSFMGSDDRIRTMLPPYASSTSRTQPKTSGFIMGWPTWARVLIEPKPEKMIIGIDYASEEFLISGILSSDQKMVEAYNSSDPYLHFAKLAGAVPLDATKESHPLERKLFKATVLGLSYDLGYKALSRKLTADVGREISEDEAFDLKETFMDTFSSYSDWREGVIDFYFQKEYLKLADGWTLYKDVINERSIANFPVQGTAAVLMRHAVEAAFDEKLKVIMTAHDAIYIECDLNDWSKVPIFAECMSHGFHRALGKYKLYSPVRLDVGAWSPGLKNEILTCNNIKVKCQDYYTDDRAIADLQRYSKYFI
ncbi:MAG: DNA polymerase [Bacteriovoracales bacterium]